MPERDNSPVTSPAPTDRRRSSFSASTLADLFSRPSYNGSGGANSGTSSNSQTYAGPITSAAAQAQRRRLSLTTLGLSGSPNQTSPFNSTARSRGESISSATSGSVDESPFEDDLPASSASVPATPFARRLSFGARALRDVRTSNGSVGNANGRPSVAKPKSPPTTTKSRGEGFNVAENLRSRAERSSISGPSMPTPSQHHRAKSMAAMEPSIREVPKAPKAPDAFQERILKGDFYMD